MPRYRKLHVKTLESLDMNDMPDDFTRLMWVLLPLALCREGRGIHHPAWLKSKLFPLRFDVTEEMVTDSFDWLIERGMVETYQVGSRDYFYVPSFHRYQGNTIKEAESDYPPPPDLLLTNSGVSPESVQSRSVTDANATTNATTNADATATTDAAAAVQAMRAHGMTNAEDVLGETQLTPAELIANVGYAQAQGLGAGWLRTEARQNRAHAPPDPSADRRRFIQADYVQR